MCIFQQWGPVVILGAGAIRVLNKLALDASLRQATIAKDLNFSRSAVNQVWSKLEEECNLRIQSNLDYGALGFHSVYGWGSAATDRQAVDRMESWLSRNQFTTTVYRSQMSSKEDTRVFFHSLVPSGHHLSDYFQSLERFRKRPYSLDISYDQSLTIADYFNFGYYNAGDWDFESEYRFQASIVAARSYASILPTGQSMKQSHSSEYDLVERIIGSSLESDYFTTSPHVSACLDRFHISTPSERTLRRKIRALRDSIAYPYMELENIGLPKTVLITLKESTGADIYRLLQAQSSLFPRVRMLSGADSLVLILKIPEKTNWFHISSAMSHIVDSSSETCIFIAECLPIRRRLMDVIEYLVSHS